MVGLGRQPGADLKMKKQYLNSFILTAVTFVLLSLAATTAEAGNNVETIVFLRHGEKPSVGLGQLDCQGLNRALALPPVISKDFGRPDALFAPNPSDQINDGGKFYDYIRPFATIEPTAISLGLPVDTGFGLSDDMGLEDALVAPAYHNAFVLVAWEHKQIESMVRDLLMAHGGNASLVPKWRAADFDSMFVVKIAWTENTGNASFSQQREGLNGQSRICPN